MKNIRIALIACLFSLVAVACHKDEVDKIRTYSSNCFKVQIAPFADESNSKAYLNYTEALSRIIYENGDKILVNGHEYTLSYEDGEWLARGEAYTGEKFYAAYCDGTLNGWDSAAGPKYNFNINTHLTSNTHNKIILSGTTDDNYVLTLRPSCAILRINTGGAGASWTNVRVGFDGNKIPKQGTINPATQVITPTTYLTGVTQGGGGVVYGDFMAMRYSRQSSAEGNHADNEDDYWYVAIPIAGDQVTTTLYLGWNTNTGSSDVQHKTQGQVTLRKGYVYTLGTERQSPFNVNGIGNKRFKVSNSQYVRFSAGNLQCIRVEDPETYQRSNKWRFAEHQYDMIQGGNSAIGDGNTNSYIDLFGWGTSGDNTGRTSGIAYESYATSGKFGFTDVTADLAGTNADWGVANFRNIYCGSRVSTVNWRTLTQAEWQYLLNRAGKCGLATINDIYHGLVLLPDEGWTLPDGCSWNSDMSSYSNNSYDFETWDKMEMAGAIFLPAAGYRSGTSVSDANTLGVYWSTSNTGASTTPGSVQAYPLTFTTSGANTTTATPRNRGCSVRLVMNN